MQEEETRIERQVVVNGHAFTLERVNAFKEWRVHWKGERPPGCCPMLGRLCWDFDPDSTPYTGLDISEVDPVEPEAKKDLLRWVAFVAGLTLSTRANRM